ncbi:putative kinase [Podospora australis]|uniref:Kinase n=1 Tax=Podospora australis TaxID=1536484 RepID=A0AAN6X0A9_9PEZI|nr:putative kinase [Podospora australis]
MEKQLDQLTELAWKKFLSVKDNERCLIGIGGPPGSGKTSLSLRLTAALNNLHRTQHPEATHDVAVFVPMDGYHYSRAELDTFPDPAEAHRRRGSEFTFNGAAFVELVKAVHEPVSPDQKTIFAPSFDHALKDPVEGSIRIEPWHRVVVFEGNYVLLNQTPWTTASSLLDLKVFINTSSTDILRKRLAARHVDAGLVPDLKAGEDRADFNDIPNGLQIQSSLVPDVALTILSEEDEGWAAS